MSQWTHVNGNIRFDFFPIGSPNGFVDELKKIMGRVSTFEDSWDAEGIPGGSEGSIEYQIIEVPRGYNVSIWGDLRDFGDEDKTEIFEWFEKIVKHRFKTAFSVRDAILEVQVEFGKTYILRDWFTEKERTIKIDEIESEKL